MISRCICEVSISMKPRPMAMKNTSSGAAPRDVAAPRSHSGTTMQRNVSSVTVAEQHAERRDRLQVVALLARLQQIEPQRGRAAAAC